jgi:hypothetical protein
MGYIQSYPVRAGNLFQGKPLAGITNSLMILLAIRLSHVLLILLFFMIIELLEEEDVPTRPSILNEADGLNEKLMVGLFPSPVVRLLEP